ncbi:MAG: hypothetical protein HY291_20735 [Planctomycetes bacterium]|nr:hypothetical protein [Planctomycetota bacterium]
MPNLQPFSGEPPKGRALAALLILALAATAALLLSPGEKHTEPHLAAADLSGSGRVLHVMEAESAGNIAAPMRVREHPTASGGKCLGVDLGAGKPPDVPEGSAVFPLKIEHPGRYRLWVRAWWIDGCSNSVAASFDGGPEELVGNDGTYAAWHWVRGPLAELSAGSHALKLLHREDGIELDQLLLCNDDSFEPQGAMDTVSRQDSGTIVQEKTSASPEMPAVEPKSTVVEPAPPPAPAIPEPPALPLKKFVVGIAGCYRDGFELHLVSLGIPYVRLREDETGDIEKLNGIDLLIAGAASPSAGPGAFYRTLYAFLKSGRTAIVEDPPNGDYPAEDDPDNLLMCRGARDYGNIQLLADDSLYFKDVPRDRRYHQDVRCHGLPLTTTVPGAKIFGAASTYGRKRGGALLVREFGGGKLYYMAFPAAFAAMWRERKIDPYVVNILREAIAGRATMRLEKFNYQPKEDRRVLASDDFMRNAGQLGDWKVLEGSINTTGPSDGGERAFALEGSGTARAAIGEAGWKDCRPMVSLRLERGAAGVWQEIYGGQRLTLLLKDGGKAAELSVRGGNGKEKVLAEASVPDYPGGWRRLVLFKRGGTTYGFVDGVEALKSADAPETLGPCGVEVRDGEALFDDLRAIDVAALQPGRDVAPGEESSERCLERYRQRCFERLSVYSPQWLLKPDPEDAGRWNLALPLFAGGTLEVDGKPAARIAPNPNGGFAAVRFPENRPPEHDLALHAPGMRDFEFAGRVTDWYASSGDWSQISRWSCSPEYHWYGGASPKLAALWYKHEASGGVALEALMAPRAEEQYGEEQGRDLNLCVFGNGRNMDDGYLFTVGADGTGCRIWKNKKVVATAAGENLPSGHALHHPWFSVLAVVANGKLQLWFDRRLTLEFTDPDPLTHGKLAVWTVRNKISIGRATISLSPPDKKP